MNDWAFVKNRTASDGAVWRSADGRMFKRTGGDELRAETRFQQQVARLGYPVPAIIDSGQDEDGTYFVIEHSLGDVTLHDVALADTDRLGRVSDWVIQSSAAVSSRLMEAEAAHPVPATPWFDRAAFAPVVFEENPDFDVSRVRDAVAHAVDRTSSLPTVQGHLDYGLPNVLEGGVIDWQHHGPVPLGYDVYPALDIVAFKGGGKGYDLSSGQRWSYTAALDKVSSALAGYPVSRHLGDFLLVKCFFFLALMRPTDPSRHDKHLKWQYRRTLFLMGVDQYESSTAIDTGKFPTFDQFLADHR